MTVIIISKPKSKQAVCSQCKCVLEYEFNDMLFSFEKDYTGCGDRVARIACPNCSYNLQVSIYF